MILHSIDPDGGFGAARQLEWLRAGGQEIDRSIIIDPTLGFRPWLNNGIYNEYGTLSSMYPVDKPLDKPGS